MTQARRLGDLVAQIVADDRNVSIQMTLQLEDGLKAQDHNTSGTGGLSDPTGNIATRPNRNLQAIRDINRWRLMRSAMLDAALEMNNLRRRYIAVDVNRPSIPDSRQWCVNCIQWNRLAPAVANRDYCWWCKEYRAAHKQLPGRNLVEARGHAV